MDLRVVVFFARLVAEQDDERSANGDSDSDSERHVWTDDSDVDDLVASDNEGIDISDGEGDGGGQDPAVRHSYSYRLQGGHVRRARRP